MIGSATGAKDRNVVAFADSHKIRRKLLPQIVGNGVRSVLGAEDAMDQNIRKGVSRERAVLSGLVPHLAPRSALPCRAFTYRAFGTALMSETTSQPQRKLNERL